MTRNTENIEPHQAHDDSLPALGDNLLYELLLASNLTHTKLDGGKVTFDKPAHSNLPTDKSHLLEAQFELSKLDGTVRHILEHNFLPTQDHINSAIEALSKAKLVRDTDLPNEFTKLSATQTCDLGSTALLHNLNQLYVDTAHSGCKHLTAWHQSHHTQENQIRSILRDRYKCFIGINTSTEGTHQLANSEKAQRLHKAFTKTIEQNSFIAELNFDTLPCTLESDTATPSILTDDENRALNEIIDYYNKMQEMLKLSEGCQLVLMLTPLRRATLALSLLATQKQLLNSLELDKTAKNKLIYLEKLHECNLLLTELSRVNAFCKKYQLDTDKSEIPIAFILKQLTIPVINAIDRPYHLQANPLTFFRAKAFENQVKTLTPNRKMLFQPEAYNVHRSHPELQDMLSYPAIKEALPTEAKACTHDSTIADVLDALKVPAQGQSETPEEVLEEALSWQTIVTQQGTAADETAEQEIKKFKHMIEITAWVNNIKTLWLDLQGSLTLAHNTGNSLLDHLQALEQYNQQKTAFDIALQQAKAEIKKLNQHPPYLAFIDEIANRNKIQYETINHQDKTKARTATLEQMLETTAWHLNDITNLLDAIKKISLHREQLNLSEAKIKELKARHIVRWIIQRVVQFSDCYSNDLKQLNNEVQVALQLLPDHIMHYSTLEQFLRGKHFKRNKKIEPNDSKLNALIDAFGPFNFQQDDQSNTEIFKEKLAILRNQFPSFTDKHQNFASSFIKMLNSAFQNGNFHGLEQSDTHKLHYPLTFPGESQPSACTWKDICIYLNWFGDRKFLIQNKTTVNNLIGEMRRYCLADINKLTAEPNSNYFFYVMREIISKVASANIPELQQAFAKVHDPRGIFAKKRLQQLLVFLNNKDFENLNQYFKTEFHQEKSAFETYHKQFPEQLQAYFSEKDISSRIAKLQNFTTHAAPLFGAVASYLTEVIDTISSIAIAEDGTIKPDLTNELLLELNQLYLTLHNVEHENQIKTPSFHNAVVYLKKAIEKQVSKRLDDSSIHQDNRNLKTIIESHPKLQEKHQSVCNRQYTSIIVAALKDPTNAEKAAALLALQSNNNGVYPWQSYDLSSDKENPITVTEFTVSDANSLSAKENTQQTNLSRESGGRYSKRLSTNIESETKKSAKAQTSTPKLAGKYESASDADLAEYEAEQQARKQRLINNPEIQAKLKQQLKENFNFDSDNTDFNYATFMNEYFGSAIVITHRTLNYGTENSPDRRGLTKLYIRPTAKFINHIALLKGTSNLGLLVSTNKNHLTELERIIDLDQTDFSGNLRHYINAQHCINILDGTDTTKPSVEAILQWLKLADSISSKTLKSLDQTCQTLLKQAVTGYVQNQINSLNTLELNTEMNTTGRIKLAAKLFSTLFQNDNSEALTDLRKQAFETQLRLSIYNAQTTAEFEGFHSGISEAAEQQAYETIAAEAFNRERSSLSEGDFLVRRLLTCQGKVTAETQTQLQAQLSSHTNLKDSANPQDICDLLAKLTKPQDTILIHSLSQHLIILLLSIPYRAEENNAWLIGLEYLNNLDQASYALIPTAIRHQLEKGLSKYLATTFNEYNANFSPISAASMNLTARLFKLTKSENPQTLINVQKTAYAAYLKASIYGTIRPEALAAFYQDLPDAERYSIINEVANRPFDPAEAPKISNALYLARRYALLQKHASSPARASMRDEMKALYLDEEFLDNPYIAKYNLSEVNINEIQDIFEDALMGYSNNMHVTLPDDASTSFQYHAFILEKTKQAFIYNVVLATDNKGQAKNPELLWKIGHDTRFAPLIEETLIKLPWSKASTLILCHHLSTQSSDFAHITAFIRSLLHRNFQAEIFSEADFASIATFDMHKLTEEQKIKLSSLLNEKLISISKYLLDLPIFQHSKPVFKDKSYLAFIVILINKLGLKLKSQIGKFTNAGYFNFLSATQSLVESLSSATINPGAFTTGLMSLLNQNHNTDNPILHDDNFSAFLLHLLQNQLRSSQSASNYISCLKTLIQNLEPLFQARPSLSADAPAPKTLINLLQAELTSAQVDLNRDHVLNSTPRRLFKSQSEFQAKIESLAPLGELSQNAIRPTQSYLAELDDKLFDDKESILRALSKLKPEDMHELRNYFQQLITHISIDGEFTIKVDGNPILPRIDIRDCALPTMRDSATHQDQIYRELLNRMALSAYAHKVAASYHGNPTRAKNIIAEKFRQYFDKNYNGLRISKKDRNKSRNNKDLFRIVRDLEIVVQLSEEHITTSQTPQTRESFESEFSTEHQHRRPSPLSVTADPVSHNAELSTSFSASQTSTRPNESHGESNLASDTEDKSAFNDDDDLSETARELFVKTGEFNHFNEDLRSAAPSSQAPRIDSQLEELSLTDLIGATPEIRKDRPSESAAKALPVGKISRDQLISLMTTLKHRLNNLEKFTRNSSLFTEFSYTGGIISSDIDTDIATQPVIPYGETLKLSEASCEAILNELLEAKRGSEIHKAFDQIQKGQLPSGSSNKDPHGRTMMMHSMCNLIQLIIAHQLRNAYIDHGDQLDTAKLQIPIMNIYEMIANQIPKTYAFGEDANGNSNYKTLRENHLKVLLELIRKLFPSYDYTEIDRKRKGSEERAISDIAVHALSTLASNTVRMFTPTKQPSRRDSTPSSPNTNVFSTGRRSALQRRSIGATPTKKTKGSEIATPLNGRPDKSTLDELAGSYSSHNI